LGTLHLLLHDSFGEKLAPLAIEGGQTKPTLSVGIGVGHLLEPMAHLLDLARRAEKLAKEGFSEKNKRDGLAIILEPHSGAEVAIRDRWENRPDDRLKDWVELHLLDALPDKAAYDLRAAARELAQVSSNLLELETRRILSRKQAAHGQEGSTPVNRGE
jgi:CRISPR-associated protein Cmr2